MRQIVRLGADQPLRISVCCFPSLSESARGGSVRRRMGSGNVLITSFGERHLRHVLASYLKYYGYGHC